MSEKLPYTAPEMEIFGDDNRKARRTGRTSLEINVDARLTVSDETAERCLRLLEMWQDDNPCKMILQERRRDGSTRLWIHDAARSEESKAAKARSSQQPRDVDEQED